jgi:hypothetical protein
MERHFKASTALTALVALTPEFNQPLGGAAL